MKIKNALIVAMIIAIAMISPTVAYVDTSIINWSAPTGDSVVLHDRVAFSTYPASITGKADRAWCSAIGEGTVQVPPGGYTNNLNFTYNSSNFTYTSYVGIPEVPTADLNCTLGNYFSVGYYLGTGLYDFHTSRSWLLVSSYETPTPPTAEYTCNFNPDYPYVGNPYSLQCSDNSTGYPAMDSWSWTLTQPDTSMWSSTNETLIKTLSVNGWYELNFTVCNTEGCDSIVEPEFINVSASPATGGIQTYFQAVNGQTNGAIYGANLQLHDDETDTWSNVTADSDGTHFITTNSTATIDGYADATGFSSVERLDLAPCATSGTCLYELIMWPDFMLPAPGSGLPGDPGTGNVNLVVIVSDKDSSAGIYMAQVTVADTSGSTQASYTNEAGTKIFAVSNSSTIHVTASKTGYNTVSKTTTTSAFGPDSVRIELTAAAGSATPTPIITDASGNIVPPAVQLTASEQDEDLMATIRANAPNLVMLFILFTVMYMLKGLMK